MITMLETKKTNMEHAHAESMEVLKEHMTMHDVEILLEKNAQMN